MSGARLFVLLAVFAATGAFACDSELRALERDDEGSDDPPRSPFVLDDFEDGDTQSLNIPEGYWYFRPDETCSSGSFVIEATPERVENTHAIRARGGGCTAWGALLGLDLGGSGETFDASSFDALRLWARAEAGTVSTLSVSLLDPEHFDFIVEVSADWQELTLPLDDFAYNDDEVERPHDASRFTHLQFFVFSAEPFDFWLDDVAFVRSE